MKASIQSLAFFAALFIESTTASCGHGTSLMRRNTHMKRDSSGRLTKRVAVGNFGYLGATGPTNWQAITPNNSACAESTLQSPINLAGNITTLVEPGNVTHNFPNIDTADFENLGTTIEVVMDGKNASTTANGKEFALKQFHFHTPGEHTINGEYFPLEMHMVHEAEDGALMVVAVPFQLCEAGGSSPVLNAIAPTLDAIKEPGTIAPTGPIDFSGLVSALEVQPLSSYIGSLTTPPCTEGLTFFIATQTLPLDIKTYNAMKSVIGFNSRFVQSTLGQTNLLATQ